MLAVAAVGLLGAAIAVWLGVRDDGASAEPAGPVSGSASAPSHTATPAPALPAPALAEPGKGGAPEVTDIERGAGGPREPSRQTVVDGVRIRDHRKHGGSDGPGQSLGNIRPPDSRKLSPDSVAAINKKVLEVIRDCTAEIPRDARADNPRLQGQITVNVKAGQVSVVQAAAQTLRVPGEFAERARLCVEQRAIGLTAQAVAGEADVEQYPIQLNHALP